MELEQLKGVGKASVEKLNQLGINEVADLLFHLPLRYEDKTHITDIADVQGFQYAQIEGLITKSYVTQGNRPILVVEVADDSSSIQLKFFNFYYSQKLKMKQDLSIRAYGEVRWGMQGKEIIHPEFELSPKSQLADSLTAIYPKTEGLSQKLIQKALVQSMALLAKGELQLSELLPAQWLSSQDLPTLEQALIQVHTPAPDTDIHALINNQHPGQQRLKLEEMLAHFLALHQVKSQAQSHPAPQLPITEAAEQALLNKLPFTLTGAQQRVVAEIHRDMAQQQPMQRLVQGDVGSGKTVVAALAIQAALSHGKQSVMMAPTEILAEQHYIGLQEFFEPEQMTYLSGSIKGKAREAVLEHIASSAQVIIGTHALFQQDVIYRDLALVVVDEQHRFGVHQRLALKQKGADKGEVPHNLIMTATPIPRTLAQVAYANLDISVIDELPPGRKAINTVLISNDKMPQLAKRIIKACSAGEQAYWVCTLIEESENLRAKAAEDTYQELQDWFPDIKIGLVHGRLKGDEKKHIMAEFKANQIQLLVATTVIEVGVDVPNASLMVIDNAERLGLSQLHQLRGRVGRGNRQSHCVLMYQGPLSQNAQTRLQTMRNSNDGFEIARQDLKLRGPGEILGTAQKGSMAFRLSDPEKDSELFETARELAEMMLKKHPENCKKLTQRWHRTGQELAKV